MINNDDDGKGERERERESVWLQIERVSFSCCPVEDLCWKGIYYDSMNGNDDNKKQKIVVV
jgi:hypothetical protein